MMSQTNIKKKLTVLCGIPCSGKSTWARDFRQKKHLSTPIEEWQIISKDEIRLQQFGENYRPNSFDEEKVSIIANRTLDNVLLNPGITGIILDNTHCKRAYLVAILEKYGKTCDVDIMYFDITLSKALYRNHKRRHKTGKWIPENVIKAMYKNYKKLNRDEFKGYSVQSKSWFSRLWDKCRGF